jgi:hypothetical protein
MQHSSGVFRLLRQQRVAVVVFALAALATQLDLAAASASTPPARELKFDPVRGSVGGVRPADRMAALKTLLGNPDWHVDPGGGPVWIWLRNPANKCTVWAEALADGAHAERIGDLVYRGAFVTSKGDRLGTPLRVVKRHWPGWKLVSAGAVGGSQGPNYGHVTRWGSVAFGFDKRKRLAGVAVRGSTQYWQPIVFACPR